MYPSSFKMRAISVFSLEAGISTFWCLARIALRMRASMSATGSVNLIFCFSSSRPFAPKLPENPRQLTYFSRQLPVASRQRFWLPTTSCDHAVHGRRRADCFANDRPRTTNGASTSSTSKRRESRRAAPVAGNTDGRCRTSGYRPADVRRFCSGCACATKISASSRPSLVLL